ncbi:MAG: exosortase/archaeosortase family protein [Lentisphaerae bacterium]|nr:exosortase/archaeosortase family protein [Lentisphaerota bacterium]
MTEVTVKTSPGPASPPPALPPPEAVPPVAFLLPLALGLLVFAWPTLAGLAGVYRTDGNFSHGFLVPVIAAYAAWRLRAAVPWGFRPRHLAGGLPLVAGVLMVLMARWYELALVPRGVIAMFLAGLGLVLVVVGLAWLAGGLTGVRRLAFPLGFLLLAVPVPSFLLNRVTIPLQQLAAWISTMVLRGLGIAVSRQGSVLSFPSGQLGVDEACSGIRSLAVLAAVSLAMIHFSRLSRRAAIGLLLAVVPVAVLTNAVRVFVSGIFYARGWLHLTHGGPHELLGLLTFALAIASLAGLVSLLTPAEEAPVATAANAPAARAGMAPGLGSLADVAFAAALILFGAAAASVLLDRHYDRLYAQSLQRLTHRLSLETFPRRLGPYIRIAQEDLSETEFNMLDPTDQSLGTYLAPDGRRLSATVLYWSPPEGRPSRRPDLLKRPHSPDWCYPAAGWRRRRDYRVACPPDVFPGEAGHVRLFERQGQAMLVVFWTGVTAARTDALDQILQRLADMVQSWHSPPLANLHTVTISTMVDEDPDSAFQAALDLARAMARVLPDYGIGVRPEAP